jgi:PAS domain S-box-containing protein
MTDLDQSNYRSLFSSNIVGIIVADLNGYIHSANDSFLSMVGYDRNDLPFRWDDMTPPEWGPQDAAHVQELQKTGMASPFEKEYFRKDGTRVPVRIGVALVEGTREQCVCFVQDLTESKKVEAALRRSDELFRSLYEQIPLMYFKMDRDGNVQAVNGHGAAELGYTPAELVGKSVLEIFHPEDRQEVLAQLEALVHQPGEIARWEFRKVRKDGSVLWVRELARAVRDSSGQLTALVACHDITAEREAQESLQRYRDRLKLLTGRLARAEETERQRIAASLHDHLGQPLTMIKIRLGLMKKQADAARMVSNLSQIEFEIDELITAMRSLTFELSSPILRELGLEPALLNLCQRNEKITGIHFAFDGSSKTELDNEPRMVIYRMVSELMFNAIKHSQCKKVSVAVLEDAAGLQIGVADDGVGFDPDDIAESDGLSAGFGLFNVREQLEQLGGNLRLHASPGEGTRAIMTIPVEDSR